MVGQSVVVVQGTGIAIVIAFGFVKGGMPQGLKNSEPVNFDRNK